MMNPTISNVSEEAPFLKFRLSGVDVSVVNGLRRIIVAEIPTVVFRTTPYEKNNATFEKNTSRLNNELIGQRLSCIPIHITDTDFPIENYVMEVDKKNESDSIQFVTTEDFKIKDITTNKYLTDAAVKKIFPPNKLTDDYIDFVRLRPRISDDIPGEHLKMSCKFAISTAQEDSAFNVVATGAYSNSPDPIRINEEWELKEAQLKKNSISKEDLEFAKKDWFLLDAKRYSVPNSFEFIIESVGPFAPMSIVHKACHIMLKKLENFKLMMQNKSELIVTSETTIPHSFDINMPNEGYTLGKVIEGLLYNNHYGKELTYCGFKKPHPHIDISLIRLGFKDAVDKPTIIGLLSANADQAIKIYEKIAESFKNVE
jgi:DNA-directed RNA polymerase subunit L